MKREVTRPRWSDEGMMKAVISLFACVLLGSCTFGGGSQPWFGRSASPANAAKSLQEVVIIPTLGTDHQFNLDYTVAHLQATLDVVGPDALIVADYTEWLRNGCVWGATLPENHATLSFAKERAIPIFGTRTATELSWYKGTVKATQENRAKYPDIESVRDGFRRRLDQTTARIARDYTLNPEPQTLEAMLRNGFNAGGTQLTAVEKAAASSRSKITADSIMFIVAGNPGFKRWVIVLPWQQALLVQEELTGNPKVRVMPVQQFLSAATAAVPRRMDDATTAWILSGLLDEWFGMWAPQVFPSQRIASMLRTLEKRSPRAPMTRFLRARWHMQNREYAAAEGLLTELARDTVDSRVPFPINPKWIRPPLSSIRDKARLNLAFVYDIRGARDSALALYGNLLSQGENLNAEAQAAGYNFDDIRFVIESYTRDPYTGLPEEAFRHFPGTAGVPSCDPHKAELAKK